MAPPFEDAMQALQLLAAMNALHRQLVGKARRGAPYVLTVQGSALLAA